MLLQDLAKKENFTDSEQLLANYILSNYHEVLKMTAKELAQTVYISAPTVVRLCKKLGFDSYTAFKVQLSKETTSEYMRMVHLDYNVPFGSDDNDTAIIEKIAGIAMSSIIYCRDHFDYSSAKKISRLLAGKQFIDIYGVGHSLSSAREFCEKMNHIGHITTATEDISAQSTRAFSSNAEQAAILISYSGYTTSILRLAQILHQRGTPIVVLTGNRISPMLKYATHSFIMSSEENINQEKKIDSFSALYILHYVLDCLYAMVFSLDYENNSRRTKISSQEQASVQAITSREG